MKNATSFKLEYYKESKFKELDIADSMVNDREFYKCTFDSCNMSNVIFQNCRIEDCEFHNCDLSLSKLNESEFIAVKFYKTKMIGMNWTEVKNLNYIVFDKCKLSHSSFYGLSLKLFVFKDCLANEVDFTNANLNKANLSGTDFEGSKFNNTDLSQADFTQSRNYNIDPNFNIIKKAVFSIPEVITLLQGFDIKIK
ncbi:MAG: pentapeptide repeat-containing protein [Ignavibacteriaceae bacterium]|nr:pentapeptide repeat-containing protein [Ignavibacteriaceae bacterium]